MKKDVHSDELLLARRDALKAALEERIKHIGATPITVAKKANLKSDAIRNLFRGGSREPGVFKIADVASVLGCTVDDLLYTGNDVRGPLPLAELSNKYTAGVNFSDTGKAEDIGISRREVKLNQQELDLLDAFRELETDGQRKVLDDTHRLLVRQLKASKGSKKVGLS